MATVNDLRTNMDLLAISLRELVTITRSIVEAPAPPMPPPTPAEAPAPPRAPPSDIHALATALAGLNDNTPKEHQGQVVHPANFDLLMPSGITFTTPAEPRHAPDHAQLVKNEGSLYKWTNHNRVDPRKASRSYYYKIFVAHVSHPFKYVVLDSACYEDYLRNTGKLFYCAMCVWHTRLVPGGMNERWIDEASPYSIWNIYTKRPVKVKSEAFTGDSSGTGFNDYLIRTRHTLDIGGDLEIPKKMFHELYEELGFLQKRTSRSSV